MRMRGVSVVSVAVPVHTPLATDTDTFDTVISPVICASLGYAAVFGSATNTVIAPILIGLEVFGSQNAIPLVVVCLLAYMVNGNHSIYGAQVKARCSFEEK